MLITNLCTLMAKTRNWRDGWRCVVFGWRRRRRRRLEEDYKKLAIMVVHGWDVEAGSGIE